MNTIRGRMSVDGDVRCRVSVDGDPRGALSVGTVVFRDGTNDYSELVNKPSIEGVTLEGDRLLGEFGEKPLSNIEIKEIVDRVFKEG